MACTRDRREGRSWTRLFSGPTLPPACRHQHYSPGAKLSPAGLQRPPAHSAAQVRRVNLELQGGWAESPEDAHLSACPGPHPGETRCWADRQFTGWAGDGNFCIQWVSVLSSTAPHTLPRPNPACTSMAKNHSLSGAPALLLKEHSSCLRHVLPRLQDASWQLPQDPSWEGGLFPLLPRIQSSDGKGSVCSLTQCGQE